MEHGQLIASPAEPGRVAPAGLEPRPARQREPLGARSLREMVELAIAEAERQAIRRALALAKGNKSQAARILQTNYTTLHAKMRRFGISAKEFRPA